MRAFTIMAGVGLLLGVAIAQKQPASTPSKSTENQTKNSATSAANSDRNGPKIRTYKGSLVAASCAAASGEASQNCGVSANATEFALKTSDGRTLAFDLVGNERAQQAIKNNKKWEVAATSGKPIPVKVNGTEEEGKLTVMSIQ